MKQNNSVWMIEQIINGIPHWWVRAPGQYSYWNGPDRWTTDPNKGRKYVSKEAAEFVIGNDMIGCVATEHLWVEQKGEFL